MITFLYPLFEAEFLNSGNDNPNIRFWLVVHNLMTCRIIFCIILIICWLKCLQYREVNIACTRFVQRFLRFSRPQTAQNNSQKIRLKNHSLLYKYNPAPEANLHKRKPRSNYHIIEIMCCLCIFYDRMINSGKRLLQSLFIRLLYWNSCYLCIIYMALWK